MQLLQARKSNRFLLPILMLMTVSLFLAGCGESSSDQRTRFLEEDGRFSTPIPLQLEKIPDGSTLTAELSIDGGAPIAMTVNGDNVSVITPELEAGIHAFTITYFLDKKRIASVSTKATIIPDQNTAITFDISQLDQDLDRDGFTGIDEVIAGSDPDIAASTPETNAPTAKISFPPPVSLTDANQITVRGTAIDETDISAVLVNGVSASTSDEFANWEAIVPLTDGDNTLIVETSDTLGNTNTNAASATMKRKKTIFPFPNNVTLDSLNNRALVIDSSMDALIAVSLTTGDRSILSGGSPLVGGGPAFVSPQGVTLGAANNRALVIDSSMDALIAVDLTTGDRSILSGGSPPVGGGQDFVSPQDVAVDSANNRALVIDSSLNALIAVDLTTGDRSILSDGSPLVGGGPGFAEPVGLSFDFNRALVIDSSLNALIAVNLTTGDRSILSSASSLVGRGSGPGFAKPVGVSLSGALVIDSSLNALIAVDLTTGNRSILSGGSPLVGGGPAFVSPQDVTVDLLNNRALVIDSSLDALIAVSLTTGDRSILWDGSVSIGDGPAFLSPEDVTLDAANNRVLVINSDFRIFDELDALIAVDLATGDRSVLSGSNPPVGSGPRFRGPRGLALDAAKNRALVVDFTDSSGDDLFEVDLTTGDRSILSGPGLFFPRGVTLDAANNRALVTNHFNSSNNALITVDLTTGDSVILSGESGGELRGTGPAFVSLRSVTLDATNNRALVIDSFPSALFAVDLTTGSRSIFSGGSPLVGTGPAFVSPVGITLDEANNRALVADITLDVLIAVNLTTGNRSILSGGSLLVGGGPTFSGPRGITLDAVNNLALVTDITLGVLFAVDLENGARVIISH